MDRLQDMTVEKAWALYRNLVTTVIPGPLSWSYFVPVLLLPSALMIPPSLASRRALIWVFLPVIYACTVHAWIAMGGVDVCSVDLVLWSTFLLAFSDPRSAYKRLRRVKSGDIMSLAGASIGNGFPIPVNEVSGEDQDQPSRSAIDPTQTHEVSAAQSGNSSIRAASEKSPQYLDDDSGVHEEPYPQDLLCRLGWVIGLISSARLFSWKIGSPLHDKSQSQLLLSRPITRMQYSLSILPKLLVNFLVIHPLTTQLVIWNPDIPSVLPRTEHPPKLVSAILSLIPSRVLTPMTIASYAYTALTTTFQLALPFVCASNYLLRLPPDPWSPQNMPTYFGSFGQVTKRGLSGLWGAWWHQFMRFMTGGVAGGLADVAGLKRGTNRRYTFIVLLAFFLSGVTHMGMVPPLTPHAWQMRMRIVFFFFSQGIGVVIETAVVRALKKVLGMPHVGSKKPHPHFLLRLLIFMWVVAWLCITNPLLDEIFNTFGWYKLWPPLPPWGEPGSYNDDSTGKVKWFLAGHWIP